MSVNINHLAFEEAVKTIPKDKPITMVNLLRYREVADYGDRLGFEKCSGKEAYMQRYVPAFQEVVAAAGAKGMKIKFMGDVHTCGLLLGPEGEKWDAVLIVEWSSVDEFYSVVTSKNYTQDANHHRVAAVADCRLIPTEAVSV